MGRKQAEFGCGVGVFLVKCMINVCCPKKMDLNNLLK